VVVGRPGTHPPGWVQCHAAPATPDSSRTADPKGFSFARSVREQRSRTMRARCSVHEYSRRVLCFAIGFPFSLNPSPCPSPHQGEEENGGAVSTNKN
jgi:hypothetical protein